MFSFLQRRFQLPSCHAGLGLVLLAWSLAPQAVHAQAPTTVEPVPPTARIVAYGSGSPFDLTDLGPDFSTSWLTAAVPALADSRATPLLAQRVVSNEASGGETRTTYDRASDGRLLAQRVEQRHGASWTPVKRISYDYRGGALVAQRTDAWVNGAWAPDQRITLDRTAAGTVHTVVQQTRHDAQWVNEARLTRQVAKQPTADTTSAPEARQRLVRATWIDGAWDRTARTTFTVAEEGRLITQRNETWTGSQWVDSVRLTYMYDGAGYPIERSLSVWVSDGWADGPLHLYDYAVHGERVEQRTETWIGARRLRTSHATLTYTEPVQTPLLGSASFD
jgi:hypothetical protein